MRIFYFISLTFTVVLVHATGINGNVSNSRNRLLQKQNSTELKWWQESVIYQIYPRSFKDSDGDGIGDINGIISKLDYFVDLGIEAIWISPIYKSPMKDFGYDISDFRDIEPIFGTLEDFKRMSTAFKERGLKLIMDFVPNHSSDLHEWFQKSVQRIDPFTDYYVWKDPNGFDNDGNPIVPNNWTSMFGGSMWEWNDDRQQFYLHQFIKEQPDLNFENHLVWNEMLAVEKFWLDLGVDGFRVDAVLTMFEDQRFLDEPINPDRHPDARPDEYRYYLHPYTHNQPKVIEWLADFRQLIDTYSAADGRERCMVIEATLGIEELMKYYGNATRPVANFPFNFFLLDVNPLMDAKEILDLLNVWPTHIPEGQWGTSLIGNHDTKRAPTKFSEEAMDAANMINLLVKGTAITYYGEEIGMVDTWISWEDTVDPAGCNMGEDRYEQFSRDPARTPFQWDSSKNAGFSTANKTWLPVNDNYLEINVATESSAVMEESHLKVYKELVQLRKTNVWKFGNYQSMTLNDDQVLGFTRIAEPEIDDRSFLILANFGNSSTEVDATVFQGVPNAATIITRSVGFESTSAVIGNYRNLVTTANHGCFMQLQIRSEISTAVIPLGPKNSIVLSFPSPSP